MNTYLIELSVKGQCGADFRQVMTPTYTSLERARKLFDAYAIIKGSQMASHGMACFYSTEGYYPMARLLILDTSNIPGQQSDIDKLLDSLVTPVSFIAPVVPCAASGGHYIVTA